MTTSNRGRLRQLVGNATARLADGVTWLVEFGNAAVGRVRQSGAVIAEKVRHVASVVAARARRVAQVIARAKYAGVFFGGLAAAVLIGWALAARGADGNVVDLLSVLRAAAVPLQIFGAIEVWLGMRQLLEEFGIPQPGQRIRDWGRQLLAAFRAPVPVVLTPGPGRMSWGGLQGTLTIKPAPPTTLEERVRQLEEALRTLRSEYEAKVLQLGADLSRLKDELQRERNERLDGDANVRGLVKRVSVGGVDKQLIGLLWVIIGTILSGL